MRDAQFSWLSRPLLTEMRQVLSAYTGYGENVCAMKPRSLFGLLVALLFVHVAEFAQAESSLLQDILKNENRYNVLKAEYTVSWTNDNVLPADDASWNIYITGNYGFENGKFYLRAEALGLRESDNSWQKWYQEKAWDGKRYETFMRDHGNGRLSGTIRRLANEANMEPSPHLILGRGLIHDGCHSLTEILALSSDVEVVANDRCIDGISCTKVTAKRPIGLIGTSEQLILPYSLWLDPKRGYCVMRIEEYLDSGGTLLQGAIANRGFVDVKGVWLPTSGEMSFFRPGTDTVISRRLLTIARWEVVDDIADSRFTIDYPAGTRVRDSFADTKGK